MSDPGGSCTRCSVRYEGRVQGVGFRYTVAELARGFSLTGQVRNEPDGSVSLLVEGSRAQVDALLDAISRSRLDRYILSRHLVYSPPLGDLGPFHIAG